MPASRTAGLPVLMVLATALTASASFAIAPAPTTATIVRPAAPTTTATPGASTLATLWPDYDAARSALANDRLGELPRPAKQLERTIAVIDAATLTAERAGVPGEKIGSVRELLPALRKASRALASAANLPDARKAFGELSKSLIAWRKLSGSGPDVGFCPMVASEWLQQAGTPVENPYGGRAMATCGEVTPPHR